MACAGCGLVVELDEQYIDTGGYWGGPSLNRFGVNDTVGAPVYCDAAGELRTPSEHTSAVYDQSWSESGVDGQFGPGPNTITAGPFDSGTDLADIENPSAVRSASVLMVMVFKFQIEITDFTGAALRAEFLVGPDVIYLDLRKYIGYGTPEAGPVGIVEELITESCRFRLAAGGDATVVARMSVIDLGGSVEGTFHDLAVGVRALIVTE